MRGAPTGGSFGWSEIGYGGGTYLLSHHIAPAISVIAMDTNSENATILSHSQKDNARMPPEQPRPCAQSSLRWEYDRRMTGLEVVSSSNYLALMLKAFEFCISTKATSVPSGPDWIREVKYDCYRLELTDVTTDSANEEPRTMPGLNVLMVECDDQYGLPNL